MIAASTTLGHRSGLLSSVNMCSRSIKVAVRQCSLPLLLNHTTVRYFVALTPHTAPTTHVRHTTLTAKHEPHTYRLVKVSIICFPFSLGTIILYHEFASSSNKISAFIESPHFRIRDRHERLCILCEFFVLAGRFEIRRCGPHTAANQASAL